MPDEYVRRRKGPSHPIYNQRDRAENIDSSPLVDYAFIAPRSSLALAKTVVDPHLDAYVEHKEHEAERIHFLKSLFLGSLAIRLVVNEDDKVNSTTALLEQYGYEGALARCLRLGELELSTTTTAE